MDAFWEIVASNALLVAVLALGVGVLGRVWKNPAGLHVLWVLVLLKLFLPPIVTVGLPLPVGRGAPAVSRHGPDRAEALLPVVDVAPEDPAGVSAGVARAPVSDFASPPGGIETRAAASVHAVASRSLSWSAILAWTWCLGIAVLAASHAWRVLRFGRLLRGAQSPPADVHRTAERIGRQLGLKRMPEILTLPVRLSPLVWFLGGRPRVILPAQLVERLDADAREAILAHELAHVRRRDHLTRLLELVATTVFWWHPVVWWASRRLRALEEQCCDAAVLQTVPHGPRTYATALLDTLDFLSETPLSVPMGATAARSPLSLARRIEMLTGDAHVVRLTPGRMLLVAALAALPMAVAFAAESSSTGEDPRAAVQEPGGPPAAEASIERRGSRVGGAAREEPASEEKEKSVELHVGQVEEIAAEEPGARAFRFAVDVPKGRRFRVTQREVSSRSTSMGNFVFENERDEPALVEIRFEYVVNYQGDKSGDVLLSGEKLLQYEAKAEGCYPPGVTTFASVPLSNRARSEKKLLLLPPGDELSKAPSGVRVLLVVPKGAHPQTPEDVEKLEPRGELIVSLEPMPDRTRKPDPVVQLRGAWHRADRAVGTAWIKYRRYRMGPSSVQRIPHESVAAVLSPLGPNTRPEQLLPVVRDLLEAQAHEHWGSDWGTRVFRCVGLRTLDTCVREGELASARLYDGEIDVRYDVVNRQVDVHRAGNSTYARTPLSAFRISAPEGVLSQLETSSLEDGRVRLSHDRLEVVADPSTGFIHRYVLLNPAGNRRTESFQYGPTTYPGGICYPRLKLHLGFRDGKLDSIDLIVIDEARFNGGFSDPDFAIALPAGATVVDYRDDTFRPAARRLTRDVDDAAEYFQPSAADKPAGDNETTRTAPRQPGEKRSPEIIVAEHVILMDGRLVTPPEVDDRLRRLAAGGPTHPEFYFTHGALHAGKWQEWHDRALDLHRELRFTPGFSLGSTSVLASGRYDAIRTAGDLRPDPSRRIEGTARWADGRPAAGATVVFRERSGWESLAISICLHEGGLRLPLDEVWTRTDEQGRFAVYPARDDFSLAVLHPNGFAAADARQVRRGEPIVLKPWATIDLTLRRSPDRAIGASLNVCASPAPDAVPLNFDAQLETGEESRVSSRLRMPSGAITVSTMIPVGEGVSVSVSRATFQLGPGEARQIELGPPTEEDVRKAEGKSREIHGDDPAESPPAAKT